MATTDSEPEVTFRKVTKETVRRVCDLRVAPSQEGFVAPNAVSIAEAYFEPKAWFRAVYAGEEPVGFVMLYVDESVQALPALDHLDKPLYYLWRFMIAAGHQGRGYGARSLRLVIRHVGEQPGARSLYLSVVPGQGSAEAFYERFGFERTGHVHEGEVEMRLALDRG